MAFRWIQSTKCQYILESCCVCYDMLMPQWVGDVLPYTTQKWDVNGPGGIFHQSSPRENESYSIFFEGKTKKTTITLKKKKGSNFLQEIVLVLAIFQFASFQSCKQWKKKERKRQREREGGEEERKERKEKNGEQSREPCDRALGEKIPVTSAMKEGHC